MKELKVVHGEISYLSDADDQTYGTWCPVSYDTEHRLKNGTVFVVENDLKALKERIAELTQERDECAIVIASMVRQTVKDGNGKPLVDFCGTAAKALEQRDLEMQAKGAVDVLNKSLDEITLPEMSALRSEYFKAGITALAYAVEQKAKQLRNQARGE